MEKILETFREINTLSLDWAPYEFSRLHFENMRNITSLSIWAHRVPGGRTLWQIGFRLFLSELVRAGVRLKHVGIHIADEDDPKERRLLGVLLSSLTETQSYLPFLKTLDASADSRVIRRRRHQPLASVATTSTTLSPSV